MSVFQPALSKSTWLAPLLWGLALVACWFPVIYLLGAQWSLYEAYNYGWAVPFLCLILAWQKFRSLPPAYAPGRKNVGLGWLLLAAAVFSFMRVLQEANPLWRLASYGLALAAAGMTLSVVYLTGGARRAAHFLFPIAFFLVAVPWPTPVEQVLIQTLTRFNSGLAVELLNLMGIPALRHGNVIEVSAGMVGIDEACSGIRSFQATLMMALFFGAFYRICAGRRWRLLAVGLALALGFNLVRTLVLVIIAARNGLPTMEKWHDTTGVALLVGCFSCLWGVAVWLAQGEWRRAEASSRMHEAGGPTSDLRPPTSDSTPQLSTFPISVLSLGLVIWALMLAAGNEVWFRQHELRDGRTLTWTAKWPAGNSTLRTNILSVDSLRILRCDEHSSANWTDDQGVHWQAFFLRWLPAESFYGRAREALSKGHNPAECLTAEGLKLESAFGPVRLSVRPDLGLWFNRYVFAENGVPLYVFFCQTEDVADSFEFSLRKTHWSRLQAALVGSRNYGQNNFEVALSGPESADAALQLLSAQLPILIQSSVPRSP